MAAKRDRRKQAAAKAPKDAAGNETPSPSGEPGAASLPESLGRLRSDVAALRALVIDGFPELPETIAEIGEGLAALRAAFEWEAQTLLAFGERGLFGIAGDLEPEGKLPWDAGHLVGPPPEHLRLHWGSITIRYPDECRSLIRTNRKATRDGKIEGDIDIECLRLCEEMGASPNILEEMGASPKILTASGWLVLESESWPSIRDSILWCLLARRATALELCAWVDERITSIENALLPTLRQLGDKPRGRVEWQVELAGGRRRLVLSESASEALRSFRKSGRATCRRGVVRELRKSIPELRNLIQATGEKTVDPTNSAVYAIPDELRDRIIERGTERTISTPSPL